MREQGVLARPLVDELRDPRVRRLRGDPDGVLDHPRPRASVRDDAHTLHAEQRRAAIPLVVEPGAGSVETGPEGQQRQRRDRSLLEVLAQRAEDEAGDALEELDDNVADEAIADDDVGPVSDHVVRLDVADEMQVRGGQLGVRLAGLLVPLVDLLADVQQADPRVLHAEDVLGKDRAHGRELDEVVGLGVHVGADVEQHDRAGGGDHVGRERRTVDPADAPKAEDRGGHRGAGRAGADHRIGVAVADQIRGDDDRGAALRAQRGGRMLPHLDHLGRVDEAQVGGLWAPVLGDLAFDARHVTDKDDLVSGSSDGVVDRSADDFARGEIATHRVDRDPHRSLELLAFGRPDRLDRDRLAPVVPPAGGAHVMGALQLVTVLALDQRRCADREMRAALTLARLGHLSLGNAHAETP
jgi:hypothetical protein